MRSLNVGNQLHFVLGVDGFRCRGIVTIHAESQESLDIMRLKTHLTIKVTVEIWKWDTRTILMTRRVTKIATKMRSYNLNLFRISKTDWKQSEHEGLILRKMISCCGWKAKKNHTYAENRTGKVQRSAACS